MSPSEDTFRIAMLEELFHPYYHKRCIVESPAYRREGVLHPDSGYVQFYYREGGAIRGLDFHPTDLVLRVEEPIPLFATMEERDSFPVSPFDSMLLKFYLRRAGVD